MFTGLVEEVATVQRVTPFADGRRVTLQTRCAPEVRAGDSLALNGVCLTAEKVDAGRGLVTLTAVSETLRRTTAGCWRRGTQLHLERALAADARLGGHFVQGHVDGVAPVLRTGREGREFVLSLRLPPGLRRYVVAKGSLAVDGVSLTVGSLNGGLCRLFIIPETLARTRIGAYRTGDRVNLEVDLVAKYVESLTAAH